MLLLTELVDVRCDHVAGKITIPSSQRFVTINTIPIVIEPDPIGKSVAGCPNVSATMKPCLGTITVETGYSSLIRIRGKRVCMQSLTGLTDGTPPGIVKYTVVNPGQNFVKAIA
jgi:hypothetical protein